MSGNLALDWVMMAVSLFNTVLLVWLGLTVLFNSDRRAWGIWLASGGLLLGGAFFVSHTAIVGQGLVQLSWWSMIFWWAGGLAPAIVLPFAWYVVTLWYAGFWEPSPSSLRRRQRPWFILVLCLLSMGLAGLGVGIFLLSVPAPEFANLRLFIRWSVAGIPLLALGYSGYVILCIGLSLDALRRPGPSARIMGAAARQRARPWLVGAALALLLVSLLVAGVMLWVVQSAQRLSFYEFVLTARRTIAWVDLLIAGIISLAILLLGQAIVSYEIFTGRSLPRRGLQRHWRRAVILAAGYGLIGGGAAVIQWHPVYPLLMTTLLMTLFFALFSWRSYAERERYIDHLRPFVASQGLYDQLLTETAPPAGDIAAPFHTLCAGVLGAQVAYLVAWGPLAPLAGPPLVHPSTLTAAAPAVESLASHFTSPDNPPLAIPPQQYGGAVWAVPLWSQRGLIGVFLLGEKQNAGLYTQEEIEIARISGERLIDTQASAEMARRLMILQRERLAQSQLIDQQTRRVLHDEILPGLQTALITLSSVPAGDTVTAAVTQLSQTHRQMADLLRAMPTTGAPEVTRLGLLPALQRLTEREFAHAFDKVVWQVTDAAAQRFARIPPLTAEVLYYAAREAMRNAAVHARGERPLHLTITLCHADGLQLQIEDNGVGLSNPPAPDPFSRPAAQFQRPAEPLPRPADAAGGQGLALHSTMMAVIGGALAIESAPNAYTRVSLTLPENALP